MYNIDIRITNEKKKIHLPIHQSEYMRCTYVNMYSICCCVSGTCVCAEQETVTMTPFSLEKFPLPILHVWQKHKMPFTIPVKDSSENV